LRVFSSSRGLLPQRIEANVSCHYWHCRNKQAEKFGQPWPLLILELLQVLSGSFRKDAVRLL